MASIGVNVAKKENVALGWIESAPNDFAHALQLYERDITARYGTSRKRGVNMYEGDHWTSEEKTYIDEVFGEGFSDNLPVRNRYRRKVDHVASMLSPGAPSVQFTVAEYLRDGTDEDAAAAKDVQSVLDSEWLKMVYRSEYQVEISRLVKDAENQHVGWVGVLPIGTDRRLEFVHIPTARIIFDLGVPRLRHLKWIAWVDAISLEHAKATFGEDALRGVRHITAEFSQLKERYRRTTGAAEDMFALIQLYAVEGAIINSNKASIGSCVFDKPTHIIQVGDRVVYTNHNIPSSALPVTHCILEADPDDITGKGLSETADELQRHLNRVVLHQAIQFMENDLDKNVWAGVGNDPDFAAQLKDHTRRDVFTQHQGVEKIKVNENVIDGGTLAALDEAKMAMDENTGMYAVGEGNREKNIPSATGQMFLAGLSKTPINAKARYLANTIRKCGEIFLEWQRVWNKVFRGKYIEVKVDVDSLLELTRQDKFGVLMQLAELGAVSPATLVEHSPLPEALREELVHKLNMQQQAQAQMMQQAQAQMMQGQPAGGPAMPGNLADMLPEGVSTE